MYACMQLYMCMPFLLYIVLLKSSDVSLCVRANVYACLEYDEGCLRWREIVSELETPISSTHPPPGCAIPLMKYTPIQALFLSNATLTETGNRAKQA